MNSFKEILNIEFSCVKKILVYEDDEVYTISDSFILENEFSNIKFQIFTNQVGVYIIDLNINEIVIDGEYDVKEIAFKKCKDLGDFITKKIELAWDINKLYIIGFVISSLDSNLYFVRLADEINIVTKEKFETLILTKKHFLETEEYGSM